VTDAAPADASRIEVEVIPGLVVAIGAVGLAQVAALRVPGWAYRPHLERAAELEGQDPDVLHALAWQESNFRPSAVGAANANGTRDYGLMQINSTNFSWLGLTMANVFDPATNARAAAKVLRAAYAQGARNVADAASIYNAGSAGSARGGGPRKTSDGGYVNQEYVRAVLSRLFWVRWARIAPFKQAAT
jgi:soluble lytic murein transglycosylase-like protein